MAARAPSKCRRSSGSIWSRECRGMSSTRGRPAWTRFRVQRSRGRAVLSLTSFQRHDWLSTHHALEARVPRMRAKIVWQRVLSNSGMLAARMLVVQLPLQITFRGMAPSDAIESVIRERAAKLERFYDRITRCHVTVDVPHRHHHKGRLYAVRIDLTTPTGNIEVTRNPPDDGAHEDFQVVVRDAFNAVGRQLQDQVRYRRGDVKAHEEPDVGAEAPEPWK